MLIDILGSMSDSAYTMTINIENIDDPPFIKNPLPDITINEDSIGVFLELIDVFDDIDSEISQIEIFSNNNDTLVNPVILNDTLFLELHTNRFGNAQVIVEAESNFKSVNDTFIINVLSVNDPPIGENSEVSIHEDSIYAFKAEDFPYSDIENDDLHGIIIKSLPNKGVFLYNNFAVNLNEMIIDFTQLSFQPEKDSIGIQYSSFSFDLVDIQNGISDSSYSMTINVLEVDDAPILIKPIPDIELIEDGPDSTMDLTEYFFDPENDSIFFSITYISDTNLIIADIVNDTTINISLKANQFGTTDIAIMGQSNLLTVTDTLSIEILSINDPPLGADSLVYGFEDSTHIFQKSDFPFFDIEDDSLIALYIRSLPQKGELLYDSMPVGFDQRINTINQLTFRPEPESMGESYTQFKYKLVDQHEAISNSSYTMTINILAVDDPPFVKNPFSDLILSEDSIGVFLVLDSLFSDIDNADSLINISLKSVSDSTLLEAEIHQDNLEIFLKENAFGSAEVMLEGLSNFKSVLDTFLITVLPVNDSPFGKDTSVVIYEDSTYHFSKKEFPFSDIEDDSLASIHLVTIPTKGRLEYDGELVNPETVVADFYELTFTPEKDSIGMNYTEFQFRLTDDDGAISDSIYKITINVLEIDDPPVIQNPITDIYLLEDAMDTLINISEVFSDPDSGDLTYSSIKNSNPNLVNIKLLDSILTFNLNENQNGKSEILLSAISNDFTITDTFWIFVEAVNDIPSDFTLFLPVNNDTIDLALHESITFSWEESFDPDFNEDVSYRIAINDTNYLSEDTTFTISTEQYKLQNEKNLELLWHVDAFSNHDTIKSSGTYGLILRNIPLAIAEEQTPKTFKLLQNYPNPFNPVTTLPYLLPKMSDISIMIYNSQGRLIDTYFMRNQPAGYHEYLWNAANFPSGLYFFKFTAGNYIDIKKCLLLK